MSERFPEMIEHRSAKALAKERKRYRVAFVTTHFIAYQAALFRHLADDPRIDFHVFVWSDRGRTAYREVEGGALVDWGVPVSDGYPFTLLHGFDTPYRLVRSGRQFYRALCSDRFDAVVVPAYGNTYAWVSLFVAALAGIPVITSGHSILKATTWWKRAIKRIALPGLFRRMQAFLPQSSRSVALFRHYGAPADRVFIFPFAVDNCFFFEQCERYRPLRESVRKELGIPTDTLVVLSVGKLVDRKRPLDILRALEKLDGGPRVCAVFVGDGPLRPQIERQATGSRTRVLLAGFRTQRELPKYFTAADVFVLPSQEDPWGAVINEAMCFGLPVVTTEAVGATGDIVRSGVNGFIYSPGAIDQLAQALGTLIARPELRRQFGERSRVIIQGWGFEQCSAGLVRALSTLEVRRLSLGFRESVARDQG